MKTVMALDESAVEDEFSKFLKKDHEGPVPHYRVFLKKPGKMQLFPKSRTRIHYSGIPAATREKVEALKADVRKKNLFPSVKAKPEGELIEIPGGCFFRWEVDWAIRMSCLFTRSAYRHSRWQKMK